MLIRRCSFLSVEPGTQMSLDIAALLSGGLGIQTSPMWLARAPHLPQSVPVSITEIELLGRIPDDLWVDRQRFADTDDLALLVEKGLVFQADGPVQTHQAGDAVLRELAWYGPAAQLHAASRWQGVDSVVDDPRNTNGLTLDQLSARYGAIPGHFPERANILHRVELPAAPASALGAALASRSTCRNFAHQPLPLADLAAILQRVWGAQGVRELAGNCHAVKKSVPSGGSLHPIEAYLIVRQVQQLAPGLYHYEAGRHALGCLQSLSAEAADALALTAVAGQAWFATAPVLIVLAARFYRNYWKYRNHPKAYRVILLDAGHLSQTLFLAAGELGYGAFITAAINEIDLEHALGLDGMQEGPLAVLGFGARADRRETIEFDPQGLIWDTDGTLRERADR